MSQKTTKNPLAYAVGAALAGSLAAATGIANAADNPFGLSQLEGGYMQIAMEEGKGEEGKAESEGKCGASKSESEGGASKSESEGEGGESKSEGEGGGTM